MSLKKIKITIICSILICFIFECGPGSSKSLFIKKTDEDSQQSDTIYNESEVSDDEATDDEEYYMAESSSGDELFDSLLNSGKKEFFRNFKEQNYTLAVECLEKAVQLQPDNAEARYFLGYAYSRLNAKDGMDMNRTNLVLTLKSSEQFEKVIQLTPYYTGDFLILDPYSKLTAEWGSLAMMYLSENMNDSASWAFKEGKRRGGFSEFFLSLNRMVLDNCPVNTILISNGDNFTIPLWYLQTEENYRNDIVVVDINLLNTVWYPRYLKSKKGMFSSLPNLIMDTVQVLPWKDSVITIHCADNTTFAWNAKASEGDTVLFRSDLLLLRILEENRFKRNIYFTMSFPEYARLNLSDNLKKNILVDKLNYDNSPQLGPDALNLLLENISKCFERINTNSQLETDVPDGVRYEVVDLVRRYMKTKKQDNAINALQTLGKLIDMDRFPCKNSQLKMYIETLQRQITAK